MFRFVEAKKIGSIQQTSAGFAQFFHKIAGAKHEKLLEKCAEQINELPRVKLEKVYSGEKIAGKAPMNFGFSTHFAQPIGVGDMISCVALAVVDAPNRQQLVAHLTPSTRIRALNKMLAPYEGKDVRLFLCEGPLDYGVLKRVYLAISKLDLPRPTIIEPESGIVIYNGEINRIDQNQKWRENNRDSDLVWMG